MIIYNCHSHLFTINHIPSRFLPKPVMWLVKKKITRSIARKLIPFTDRDLIDRYINFVEVTLEGKQSEVLDKLKGYYPNGSVDQTKFIVLPMDMEHMLAGKVKVGIDEQHEELDSLVQSGEPIIPFIGTDPRRDKISGFVKKWHQRGFKGIKLYPPLGYYPNDARLDEIYAYASENNLPVLAHCSKGGVHVKKVTDEMLNEPNPIGRPVKKLKPKDFSDIYTDPANYDPIATKYPDLRICLAHFGGGDEWDRYMEEPWDSSMPESTKSWFSVIIDLILKHDNVYADISSTLYQGAGRIDLLKVILENPKIRERVLFGSDYYMMERVKSLERKRSIEIRSQLGPALFKQLAFTNPRRYLNG